MADDFPKRERNVISHPSRVWLGIFVTCLLVYSIFWSGHQYSIDGVIIFQYTKNILFHGSFVMDPPVRWGGIDIPVMGSAMGMSVAYMPILAFWSATIFAGNDANRQIPYDPAVDYNPALLRNQPYLVSSFLNPLITALAAVALFSLCKEIGFTAKKASAAALVFAIASPATVYAKGDVNQPLASLCLLLTVLFLVRAKQYGGRNLLFAGVCLGYAGFTRSELLPISIVAFAPLAFLIRRRAHEDFLSRRRLLDLTIFLLPVLAFTILNQYTNFLRYGSWFSVGYYGASVSSMFTTDPASIGVAMIGNLISPGRGILVFYPLSLLTLPGWVLLFRRNQLLAGAIGVFLLQFYILYAMFKDWPGGMGWGPRYMVPLIPYLTLLGFVGIDALQRMPNMFRVSVVSILVAVGAISALQGLLSDFQVIYGDPWISPVLAMLKDFGNPALYDIYWLRNAASSQNATMLVFFAELVLFGFVLGIWFEFFRNHDSSNVMAGEIAQLP